MGMKPSTQGTSERDWRLGDLATAYCSTTYRRDTPSSWTERKLGERLMHIADGRTTFLRLHVEAMATAYTPGRSGVLPRQACACDRPRAHNIVDLLLPACSYAAFVATYFTCYKIVHWRHPRRNTGTYAACIIQPCFHHFVRLR